MATGKKYFWLRLKKDFFYRHDIRIIEAMPNGKEYVLFYLKLMAESVSHDGKLRFSERIPYSNEMLSSLTNTDLGTVVDALDVLEELRIIEIEDDGTIFLPEVVNMIGFETDWARKKKEWRDKQRTLSSECPQDVLDVSSMCPHDVRQEIELEKELKIEKELELDIELNTHNITNITKEKNNNVEDRYSLDGLTAKEFMELEEDY